MSKGAHLALCRVGKKFRGHRMEGWDAGGRGQGRCAGGALGSQLQGEGDLKEARAGLCSVGPWTGGGSGRKKPSVLRRDRGDDTTPDKRVGKGLGGRWGQSWTQKDSPAGGGGSRGRAAIGWDISWLCSAPGARDGTAFSGRQGHRAHPIGALSPGGRDTAGSPGQVLQGGLSPVLG